MVIRFYQNKRNPHKFQEIHYDQDGHYLVREVLRFENGVINRIGDKKLHRWKVDNLKELLTDYQKYPDDEVWTVIDAICMCCNKTSSYVLSPNEEFSYEKYWEDKAFGRFSGYIQDVFPKMPQHIRAGIQNDGICCSCPRCRR